MAKVQSFTPSTIDNLKSGKMSDKRWPGLTIEATVRGKVWRYYRRIARTGAAVKMTLGTFPAFTLADAKQWANDLNAMVERGDDPRVVARNAKEAELLGTMSFGEAWHQYITDVSTPGLKSSLKPRTIADKRAMFNRDVRPRLGGKALTSITSQDLWDAVEAKVKVEDGVVVSGGVRANRLAAELKCMFKWFTCSRGAERAGIKLATNPAVTLNGKHYEENEEAGRQLSDEEIGLLFQALAQETRCAASGSYRRAFLLLLLTGCRIKEVLEAPSSEIQSGGAIWHIPKARAKNKDAHTIYLGPWGRALAQTNGKWLIPHPHKDGIIDSEIWYTVRDRLLARMTKIARRPVEHWRPHDLRVTLRSNTFDLDIPYEAAEKMLNHRMKALERRYDKNKLAGKVMEGFLHWERHLVEIARKAGVAEALGVPS